jgi:CRP-like cAMP-binding protein
MDVRPADMVTLRQGSWFSTLPDALQQLIIQRGAERTYRKGGFIVREGEPGRGLFGVLEGNVRALRSVRSGEEVLIDIGGPGYWFAVYALLAGTNSIGSIVADSEVRVINLTPREFERIVEDEPRHYAHFTRLLVRQFEQVFRYLGETHGLSPEDWLLLRLTDLAAARRGEAAAAEATELPVSQADLATLVGVSRQTLNTLLARLERRGLIEIGYRVIRVVPHAGQAQEDRPA